MTSLFGSFQVRVDPWDVDYGSETPLEPLDDKPDEDVVLDVELPPDQWTPLNPGPVRVPERLYFVDGVRRLETRLVVNNNGQLLHGGFGSFAVGCVEVRPGRATFGEKDLGREVILGSDQCLPQDVTVRPNLIYAARSAKEAEPDAPLRTIQANMRRAEFRLARRLTDLADTLVVTDGPLGAEGKGNAVGLIKRISELYLPSCLLPVLTRLSAGTRTPVFAIRAISRRFNRIAWFLRLASVLPGESELHGLVRLEVAESVGAAGARFLADLTAVLLPRFAPPRAGTPGRGRTSCRSGRSNNNFVMHSGINAWCAAGFKPLLPGRLPVPNLETMLAPTNTETPKTTAAGVVLGTEVAGPLEFWIGVQDENLVQLDDLVVVEAPVPGGGQVTFYGIVDQVRKRYEGAEFDTDAFRAAEGVLPVQISYAAHVQTTRISPEVFMPPDPGTPVRVVHGEDFQKALYIDRMERKIPIGMTRSGEPVYANLEFLDGTRGAHASISGVSGVATKTSYATFMLYSLFHSDALGLESANTKAIIFNVKGEDLLWLDRPNARLNDEARRAYERLGLPAGPFQSVGLFAPARKSSDVPMPDTGTRHAGVSPYCWTLRQFAGDRLLRFAFADAEDARAQIGFVITQVERELERASRQGDPNDPGLELQGDRLASFADLVEAVSNNLEAMTPNAASGTRDAFRRRLHAAAQHMGHLVRGDADAVQHRIDWDANQVTVIDIHKLHSTAQMFVVGVVLKRMMERKEAQGTARPLVFVVLDELNKYAPRSGWSPIQDVLLDIAERGRSLGVSLFGAQQTASEVERRVVANAALKVVGRLDAAEAERGEYGFLTPVARRRATILSPGTMIVAQPEIPTPILLHFPFPSWATRESEASPPRVTGDDPFARLGGD